MFTDMRWPRYTRVQSDELHSGSTTQSAANISMRMFALNAWSVTTLILLCVMVGQWSFWSYTTEERSLLWEIREPNLLEALSKWEKRRFTYAIRDDDHGNLYPVIDPDELRYSGLPSPEIDTNWDNLVDGRYFRLTDSEISLLREDVGLPALAQMPQTDRIAKEGFYGGPDVLHSLHCLNSIRKHLDMEYYADSMTLPPEYRRIHIDHCVDHLRQALLCHGDLTPVTMKPVTANTSLLHPVVFYLGQTEREHTCRSTEAVRDWVVARGQQTGRIDRHHTMSLA